MDVMWYIYFIVIVSLYIVYLFFKKKKKSDFTLNCCEKKRDYTFGTKKISRIEVISDLYSCKKFCDELKNHCSELSALGFDCEWVNEFGALGRKKNPVALLQLASFQGLCCLFRLNLFPYIPKELYEILSNPNIIKLGVNSLHDARLLEKDYSVQVHSTLDLRFLYSTIAGGLAGLSEVLLGITLNKHSMLPCSNWEADELSETQKHYAAMDAYVAIEIFKEWLKENKTSSNIYSSLYYNERRLCGLYDRNYTNQFKNQKFQNSSYKPESIFISKYNNFSKGHQIRKKPLYHNCFMHAPDGELLCSCDRRKAEWYIEKNLAEVFLNEPFSIRLLFEPSARANENNEGRFYQQLKKNCCVVCGANQSYLRHNVVPREYRKHFPIIMKNHQSHDIVLLCATCHQTASYHAKNLKEILADVCNAPFNKTRENDSGIHKKIKNYGKALLKSGENIPLSKKKIMENEIKNFFNITDITTIVLQNAAFLKVKSNNGYLAHGLKVTEYFSEINGGLMELEKLWRQYFLTTMKPKYLPALWSINHNHPHLISKKLK